MTANDFFSYCVNLMGNTIAQSADTQDYFLNCTNAILQETLPYENAYRISKGQTELTQAKTLSSLADDMTYHDEVIKNIVLWGVATLIALADDDTIKAGFFDSKYQYNRNSYSIANYEDIKDIYADAF